MHRKKYVFLLTDLIHVDNSFRLHNNGIHCADSNTEGLKYISQIFTRVSLGVILYDLLTPPPPLKVPCPP